MSGERGGLVLDGLARTLVGILLFALVVFELGAIAVNHVQVDGKAQEAVRVAASAYGQHADRATAEEAAQARVAELDGAVLRVLDFEDETASITVSRPAPVLVLHRVGFLQDRLVADATARTQVR